jgi:hypothetical protein
MVDLSSWNFFRKARLLICADALRLLGFEDFESGIDELLEIWTKENCSLTTFLTDG